MSIQVNQLTKRYGDFTALDDIDLAIDDGELVALLGPSGCGKTTLLRSIAGMEFADSGNILLEGRDMTFEPIRHRQVGFVFQHYALFNHMSVFENVAYGLRVRPRAQRPPEAEIRRRVHELLDLVQLDWLAKRFPTQLSGGQRQRIALARALAVEPHYLLLDEPFGALDASVRKELRRWLRRLHEELHVTSLFVTHDQEEAMEVASRIVVMNHGRIEQVGTPEAVYDYPATPFVSTFIGSVNVLHGTLRDGHFDTGGWQLPIPNADANLRSRRQDAFVRPHDIEIVRAPDTPWPVRIRHVQPMGSSYHVEVTPVTNTVQGPQVENDYLTVELTRQTFKTLALAVGEVVGIRVHHLHWFHQETAPALEEAI
ncbi:MAG: sulfate ABC transporter ATP-binding protein [Salinicola sp.]|uniref:sulfate/molybdate ABC transporter ATP-binding protein n=1 Tax=uncultured Salinicola sp. TaxID=1193542 RepID=UPI000C88FC4A|nr:sulfate ABC transporter ATP-binding protein [uncultured Salinicola sp.]MAM58592.1 sulfate ABC transporter ATP-binding protein [Salinicola sp.]